MSDFPDWGSGGGGGGSYLSLTGAGQTTTPGKLTQLGELVVTKGGATVDIGATSGPFTDAINISTDTVINFTCGGFTFNTNEGTFGTSSDGFDFHPGPGFDFNSDGGVFHDEIGVFYGIASTGTTGTPGINLVDVGTGDSVGMFVHHGSPVGQITIGAGLAGFCIDTATPKLWAWPKGGAAWAGV